MVFNFSYWSDGKCQEKLKTTLMQNLEPISIQAEKVNRKREKNCPEGPWHSNSICPNEFEK